MTIALDSNKVTYVGNGVTTVFPFSFRVDSASDLQAYLLTTATGVLALLTQGVDYTVAGVPGTGSVTYNPLGVPMPATQKLILLRVVPVLQGLDINNQGGFYPEAVEAQLDTMIMATQQLEEKLGRAVVSPLNGVGYALPAPEANKLLAWNALGTGLVSVTLAVGTVVFPTTANRYIRNDASGAPAVISAAATAALDSWGGVTRAAGFDTFAATPTVANLRALLTDEQVLPVSVTSVANLQALDTAAYTVAYLSLAGRQFLFNWTAGNFSAQITAVDPRYIASSANPTGSAGAWIQSGSVETGQFFQTLGASVHYLADRVMIGNAVANKANPVAAQSDWLTTFLLARGRATGFLEFAQMGVLNNSNSNSANAIVAGAQTSVLAGVGNCIGAIVVGVNNNSVSSTNTYGLYAEAYRMAGAIGGAYGIEIDTINYQALAATNPFAQAGAQTVGIQLAGGASLSDAAQFAASVGLNFWNNNSTFDKGINFGFTAIAGTNGTDGNTGEAIAMATGHAITYYYGNNTKSWTLKANIGVNGNYVFSSAGTGSVVVPILAAVSGAFPSVDDGSALGSTALKWSDVFLASGAVINFNSGDVTITHAADALAFAGAANGYTFTHPVKPSANDGAALGSTALQWSDLFLADGAVLNFNNGGYTITHSLNLLSFSQGIFTTGGITSSANIRTNNPGAGIGYSTGAGGTVTQITSRTTGVTLNTSSGAITMFSAAGSATAASFTVTNSSVTATDTIDLVQKSGTNLYVFVVTAVAAGSFVITFFTTGGTATDAPVISFNLIKGVTS